MSTNEWLEFPKIEELNAGKKTRLAQDRLVSNLNEMFGSPPSEFKTSSSVIFNNVTATTYNGNGDDLADQKEN